MKKLILLFIAFAAVFPTAVLANIGVGVGTGKIQVDEKLIPGTIYELPPLMVLNTGDEPGDYAVGVSYMEKQVELKPDSSWFTFSPSKFHLDPTKAQVVKIKLNLPVRAQPGNYFALLEGFPAKRTTNGNTTVGVAAAAKLYFTVLPANIFVSIYYKIMTFWKVYSPWPQRTSILIAAAPILFLAKKHLNIEINLKKPKKDE